MHQSTACLLSIWPWSILLRYWLRCSHSCFQYLHLHHFQHYSYPCPPRDQLSYVRISTWLKRSPSSSLKNQPGEQTLRITLRANQLTLWNIHMACMQFKLVFEVTQVVFKAVLKRFSISFWQKLYEQIKGGWVHGKHITDILSTITKGHDASTKNRVQA